MEHSIPWIEKYRPNSIEDIIFDEQIEQQIKIFLEDRKNVHLMITGLPGTGKTTTVRCIAKKLLEKDVDHGFLELNAAEDRGVRSIATIIPPFCKRVVNFEPSKIILLDEADNMTTKCQCDINKMIKEYGQKTKFIFTCNDSAKIIEDIQSVCRIVRFKKLTTEQIKQYLEKLCIMESIEYNPAGLDIICYIANGDMRKAINNLQLTAYSYKKITKQTVLKICKMPDPEEIKKILNFCADLDLDSANKNLEFIISKGYYHSDIVTGFIHILTDSTTEENLKLQLIDVANQTKIVISNSRRSELQLVAMVCRLIKVYSIVAQ